MELLASASATLFLLLAIFCARDGMSRVEGRLLFVLAICLAAQSLTILPGLRAKHEELYFFARFIAVPNIGLFWLFFRSLLLDEKQIDRSSKASLLAFSVAPMGYLLIDLVFDIPAKQGIEYLGTVAPFAMLAHLIWVALSGKKDDLIGARRQARGWLVAMAISAAVASLVAEYLPFQDIVMPFLLLVAVLPAQIGILMWLLKLQPEAFDFGASADSDARTESLDPRDQLLHQQLIALVESDQIFAQPKLTIDDLAEQLEVPAHRLRKMINQGLGYRNFAAFINGYRLKAAQRMLTEPRYARTPIISIAFEAGFSSLPSFNRVFKSSVGMTPTDFRMRALADAPQE